MRNEMNNVGHFGCSLWFLVLFGHSLMLTSCAWVLGREMDHATYSRAKAEQAYTDMIHTALDRKENGTPSTLNLKQCIEMALAKNLSLQMAELERINRTHLSLADWSKMLPHAILAAKFDQGDNIIYSDLYVDSYWSEFYARSSWRLFLETRWSPTDVAIAYYTARNADNRVLLSFYEKVRLTQKIVETVEVSFFRLLTTQECLPWARNLLSLRSDIARAMERLSRERLAAADDYEKALSDEMKAQHLVAELELDFERHANALATQLGRARLFSSNSSTLVVKGSLTCPNTNEAPQEPEITALRNRPEIVALGLKQVESSNEFRKSIVKNFPRISLFWRYLKNPYYDGRFRDGQQAGVLLYMDLVDTLAQLKETQVANNQRLRSKLEMNAVALTIASQASIAAKKYQTAVQKASTRAQALDASEKAMKAAEVKVQGRNLSDVAQKKARADLIIEKIELIKSVGEANVCRAELKSALGTNYSVPVP